MYAIDEDDSEDIKKSDNGEDLWCLLEESDIEQWQGVISRGDKT